MSQHLSARLAYALHVSASEVKGGVGQRNIYLHNPVFLLMKVGLMAGARGDFWLPQAKEGHHGDAVLALKWWTGVALRDRFKDSVDGF